MKCPCCGWDMEQEERARIWHVVSDASVRGIRAAYAAVTLSPQHAVEKHGELLEQPGLRNTGLRAMTMEVAGIILGVERTPAGALVIAHTDVARQVAVHTRGGRKHGDRITPGALIENLERLREARATRNVILRHIGRGHEGPMAKHYSWCHSYARALAKWGKDHWRTREALSR